MQDNIHLLINGKKIEDFVSYTINSNLFTAGDAFTIELADTDVSINPGMTCELYINDHLELNGIIDKTEEPYSKTEEKLILSGRDLMGLVVDSYCEEYITLENIALATLAQRLLKNIPYINRKNIIFGKGSKDRAVTLTQKKEEFEFTQIEPGQTVFEALKNYAMSRGMLFYSLPDGTFTFSEPTTSGKAEYTLIRRKNGRGNNIVTGKRIRDISKRYSKVTILGQKQGTDIFAPDDINVSSTMEDTDFPFYKPFVGTTEHDGQDPKKYANILMQKQKFAGNRLEYTTYDHSQNGKNYQVNAICHVIDEKYEIEDDFLIYARTFERSKQQLSTTVQLSELGVLPA